MTILTSVIDLAERFGLFIIKKKNVVIQKCVNKLY